jgi:chorismate mutase
MYLRRRKTTADLVMERVQEIADKATDLSGKAAVALAPRVGTAREVANAAYEQASARVREEVVPKMREEYAARVRETAVPAVAAALARRQVEEPPKKHRLRKLFVVLGLAGAGAYVAKRFGLLGQSGSESSFGQTSPSGTPYAGDVSTAESAMPPVEPNGVPDDRASAGPLQGGGTEAAGATFADVDADSELGRDLTDKLSNDDTSAGTEDLAASEGTATAGEPETGSAAPRSS